MISPLVLVILMTLLVILVGRAAVLNAVALRRDINKRFDDLSKRLEDEANATVDHLLRDSRDNPSN
jgi:hypothetical protein